MIGAGSRSLFYGTGCAKLLQAPTFNPFVILEASNSQDDTTTKTFSMPGHLHFTPAIPIGLYSLMYLYARQLINNKRFCYNIFILFFSLGYLMNCSSNQTSSPEI